MGCSWLQHPRFQTSLLERDPLVHSDPFQKSTGEALAWPSVQLGVLPVGETALR